MFFKYDFNSCHTRIFTLIFLSKSSELDTVSVSSSIKGDERESRTEYLVVVRFS